MNNDLIWRGELLENMPKDDVLLSGKVRKVICEAPAADAVEVVRCRDCEYRELAGVAPFMYHCCVHIDGLAGVVSENDFCSHGERRKDDG